VRLADTIDWEWIDGELEDREVIGKIVITP
jgi:hypothetical protein